MKQEFGTPIFRTATGSTAAYATVTGVAGKAVYITDVSVSSDLATGAMFQVLSGATILWQGVLNGNTMPYDHTFSTPLRVSSGATATVSITGTAQSYANFAGFTNDQ